ncbi:unnamed protein product [Rotaria sp. Silwood2]|nr:unnamed protein product [Rotaria sp. Silwood2]CAF2988802.1 unnamed protein product [Rotaria sp. Silwood2]CAF3314844.1 unnamed protein product [Rotaria sp. Silwood2]CAF3333314.1 unnamed protein product [Rotaria sp. Silwood2]
MDMEETSPNSGWPLRAISLWDIKNQEIGLSIDEIERHITYVKSDLNFAAKLVYDRKLNDPLYMNDSFILNKDLADVLHIDFDIFNSLENYLCKQGFNSLALNVRNDIVYLIGTGVILIWLVLQTKSTQQNTFQFLFDIKQVQVNAVCFFFRFLN